MSYSTGNGSMANWGSVKLDGDDDLTLGGSYVRNLGMGIEGRPSPTVAGNHGSISSGSSSTSKRTTRSSAPLLSSGKATASTSSPAEFGESDTPLNYITEDHIHNERQDRQIRTTLALLQTFHANTCFQLSRLKTLLARHAESLPESGNTAEPVIQLTPKDILSFELGPLSSFDARYLGWLVEEYASGTKVILKRGWRDLFGLVIFGYS